jgi:hypothetical protein
LKVVRDTYDADEGGSCAIDILAGAKDGDEQDEGCRLYEDSKIGLRFEAVLREEDQDGDQGEIDPVVGAGERCSPIENR